MQISSCTYSNRNQSLAFVFPICFWADSFSSSQEPIIWQAWCLLYILSSTWSCELKSDITSVKFACTLAGTPVQRRMGLNRPLQHLWQLQVIMSWLLCMSAVWIWEHTGIVMLTAATGDFVNTVQYVSRASYPACFSQWQHALKVAQIISTAACAVAVVKHRWAQQGSVSSVSLYITEVCRVKFGKVTAEGKGVT